ncbi:hypothetical protein Fmac_017889 [Flemingia macrophylla]|uniref:Uncharacterized protein n=1 Tax=Flemingia macrophylla TaxID=520843 RepID=A0ABD1M3C3_9FABA
MEKDALENEIQNENENIDFKIDIDRKEYLKIHPKQRLQPCVARLEAAGVTIQSTGADPARVTIQSTDAEPKSTRFDLKVTFQDGKLTIPPLHITETTEAKWRNLIALELNKSSTGKQRGVPERELISAGVHEREFSALFISYAFFLRSLICCVHDVRLLRDKGVILVHQVDTQKGKKDIMSDKDLMYLFQNRTRDVPGGEIDMDSWFAYVRNCVHTPQLKNGPSVKSSNIMPPESVKPCGIYSYAIQNRVGTL